MSQGHEYGGADSLNSKKPLNYNIRNEVTEMIEDLNGFLSLGSLLIIVVGAIVGYFKLNKRFKKDEEIDEYYRDLL
ncbi:hypothetical protein K210_00720 [Erysipelothrix rhusiopathiae SY1027]|nr:hypothetical protein [Erysipelothrix rhusiopathiae]AGN23783.1 hypothetical protein K210_00720 [Erysipelothrix rhusiopathiae SY1027]